MTRKNNTVVLDMDGVLADFEGRFCKRFGYNDRHILSLEKRYPDEADEIKKFVNDPAVYMSLDPIPLGLEIVNYLHKNKYDISIVSSRPSSVFQTTFRWLLFYDVPFLSLSVDKSSKVDRIARLDPICCVDDMAEVARDVQVVGINCVLFDWPWNTYYDVICPRVDSLPEFVLVFEDILRVNELST